MSEFKHGAYGIENPQGAKAAVESQAAFIYVGTAPVHNVKGGADAVNKPIVVRNIAEAKRYLGYSDDWAKYTLCEAMHVHLEMGGIGPLIMINVLDPATHKATEAGTLKAKPVAGQIKLANMDDAILDTIAITGKTLGTDYTLNYDSAKHSITITETSTGALGSEELTINYSKIDASKVTAEDVIGSSDNAGLNTGLYAIRNVYPLTGYIPSQLLAPGWSSDKDVHDAMYEVSQRVNSHWHVYMRTDIPIADEDTPITLLTAAAWKKTNGYDKPNETTYFPLAKGTDGKTYHISVLAAANLQNLLAEQDGIPYTTPSNTACSIIERLYLGEDAKGRVYDDALITEQLNKHGIASATFNGGRWVIWGAQPASFEFVPGETDVSSANETNVMMLYYIMNDFQRRRAKDADKVMTVNDLRSRESEEQARLDALVKNGMLLYGKCKLNATLIERSDVMAGDFTFSFEITTTPLAKSLTAYASQCSTGYDIYIEKMLAA